MTTFRILTLFTAICSAACLQATLFTDPFGDGTITNNSDVNTGIPGRQSGSLTSTYTHTGGTSGTQISNNDGISTGENFARLRNNEQNSVPSNGFLSLDANFSALAGTSYSISFDLLYNQRGTSTTDQWVSFALSETAAPQGPNAGATDFGLLMRPNGVGNPGVGDNFAQFWADGFTDGGNNVSGTVPAYTANYVTFTVSVVEDGANNALVTVDADGSNLITDFAVNFDDGNRYFSFGSHLGPDINGDNATEFSDVFIDNLTVIPEPSSLLLFGGALLVLCLQAVRKRG